MSAWQAFILGAVVAWTPSLVVFVILLARAPLRDRDQTRARRPF
jgi:NhaP-type Na+/H+ and K+/H+ antiporter